MPGDKLMPLTNYSGKTETEPEGEGCCCGRIRRRRTVNLSDAAGNGAMWKRRAVVEKASRKKKAAAVAEPSQNQKAAAVAELSPNQKAAAVAELNQNQELRLWRNSARTRILLL